MQKPSLSELSFASLLVYSPRGVSGVSQRSRSIVHKIKNEASFDLPGGASMRASSFVAYRMRELTNELAIMADFWGPEVLLVPVPRSSLQRAGSLWPSLSIANALQKESFGVVAKLLERATAIPKSAFAERGARPGYRDNRASLKANLELGSPRRITLVDDVVTKGTSLLSAANILSEAYPGAEIRGFAVVRTLGLQPEIDAVLEPCVGIIRLQGDEGVRLP